MRNSTYSLVVAAALTFGAACDGNGTPTAPTTPKIPTSTFEPVCSDLGADGSQVCIADLDPLPGTPEAPTQASLVRARLTGAAPAQPNTIYRVLLVWGDEDDPPELGYRGNTGPVVSGRFDVWELIPVSFIDPGKRFRVCAALRSNIASWYPRPRVLRYSPWVEGYVR